MNGKKTKSQAFDPDMIINFKDNLYLIDFSLKKHIHLFEDVSRKIKSFHESFLKIIEPDYDFLKSGAIKMNNTKNIYQELIKSYNEFKSADMRFIDFKKTQPFKQIAHLFELVIDKYITDKFYPRLDKDYTGDIYGTIRWNTNRFYLKDSDYRLLKSKTGEIEFIVCRLSHHVKLFDVNMSHYKKFKNNKKI